MKSFHKKNKQPRRLKDTLLRSFLIISIICCVFLVSNCDQLFDLFGPGNGGGTTNPPGVGGSESSNLAATLLLSAGKGAAGDVGGAAASWAMSAIGLTAGSPDYTAQLGKIDGDLQVIISQLNGISDKLGGIKSSVDKLDCSQWQINVQNDVSQVFSIASDYNNLIITASDSTKRVDTTDISDLVNKILAKGDYSGSYISMEKVLSDFETSMILPGGSGVLPGCIQYYTEENNNIPAQYSFAQDTVYYNAVNDLMNYYYYYETEALFLYSEAQHYIAWQKAGKPNSDFLSADSVSYVCSNSAAALYCNNVVNKTNTLYNSLIQQFKLAGAPYTDDNFVLEYRAQASGSILWPKSLEDFSIAAGNNCPGSLTSANPCGITAGLYDQKNLGGVNYRGYTGWQIAGSAALAQLLAGWKSGTAGNYLQNKLGFKNMKNKVIISSDVKEISLNETYQTQYVVPFFDTDFDYNWFPNDPGQPVIDEFQFHAGVMYKSRIKGGTCEFGTQNYYSVDYATNSYVKNWSRNGFYDAYGHEHFCTAPTPDEIYWVTTFSFSTLPGWLASQDGKPNQEPSAKQFRWPVLFLSNIPCSYSQSKNTGGYWSMCGQNFIDYLNSVVPTPESCDNTNYPCYPPTAN